MEIDVFKRRYRNLTQINTAHEADGRKLLDYYHYYRLSLATILFSLASAELALNLTARHSLLFAVISLAIAVSAITGLVLNRHRWLPLYLQSHLTLLSDIVLLGILVFTRNDLLAILAVPLMIAVGGASLLFPTRVALAYAALCTLLVLFKQTLDIFSFTAGIDDYHTSGILGLSLFSTVLVVGGLATRARHTELQVKRQQIDISDMDQVSRIVANSLDLGVVTLDNNHRIGLVNPTAEKLLGLPSSAQELPQLLGYRLQQTRPEPGNSERFPFEFDNRRLKIQAVALDNGMLLLIDDETLSHQQSQEFRFASLGRMAGGVAHEIRNPLSAIQHSAQILEDSVEGHEEEAQLLKIILNNTVRINDIIESILNLSRAGKPQLKILPLRTTAEGIVDNFLAAGDKQANISVDGGEVEINFDPMHLEQAIVNLCQNAVKYGKKGEIESTIVLTTGVDLDKRPFLDVVDDGPGVRLERVDQLFEPFSSSDSKSSGLGLYISRRLCELNGARLDYLHGDFGHRFRITFAKLEDLGE